MTCGNSSCSWNLPSCHVPSILNTGMAFWKFKQLSANTHTCNPSSSAGRTQEDWGSKDCQANTLLDSISKIDNTLKGLSKWFKSACLVSMSRTKKENKNQRQNFAVSGKFSRRPSISNMWWSVSHSQDLRHENGNSTSPYYPLWSTGKIFASCSLDLVLCWFRGLWVLLFYFLSFFLDILGIELKVSAT
jgi:hypothetical protein